LLYNRWTTWFMDEPIKGQKEIVASNCPWK
jgi:hypothetical protein